MRIKLSGELERINTFCLMVNTLYWREDTHTLRGKPHQRAGKHQEMQKCKTHDAKHKANDAHVWICVRVCWQNTQINRGWINITAQPDTQPISIRWRYCWRSARDLTEEILQGINNKPSRESNPTTRLNSLGRGRYCLGEIHKSIFYYQ